MMGYSLEQIEAYLRNKDALVFNGYVHNVEWSFDKFMENFFNDDDLNARYSTYYKDGRVQCGADRRRSIGDIYRLVISYYPEVTLQQVYQKLIDLLYDKRLFSFICYDIHKRVYRGGTYSDSFFNGKYVDEFGTDISAFTNANNLIQASEDSYGYNYDEERLHMVVI